MVRRRQVGPNARSYTGRHVGRDGVTVRFESKLERDFLVLTRFRPDVLEVVEQPVTLEFRDSRGRKRRYTPDFLVRYPHKTSLIEVKFRDELRKNWPRYSEPFSHARSWARANGMRFKVVTERVIRRTPWKNANLLEPHQGLAAHPMEGAAILGELQEGAWTIGKLMKALHPDPSDRGLFWQTMWRLLANGEVVGDFERPIGMDFVIWRAQ